MMAAFPPHPSGMQPGMAHAHPGMPPGGQPMGHPMHMTPGVSGPGNPHMAQTAAMMGMQPGAGGLPGAMGGQVPGGGMGMPPQSMSGPGPNAMAMSHLTPQGSMMQHPSLQMAQNPQFMAQRQQQLQQRQAQILQMQATGMGAGPGGPHGMNPQQMAQLQNMPGFPNGASQNHQLLQLQQMQQMRVQQQQAQAQAQAQAQHQAQQQAHQQQQAQQQQAHQQQAQQGPGQNQQTNLAHHIPMQHAPSQASNHSQPGPPQQAQQQQQPGGQMRAQSQAPGGPETQGAAQPAQGQQPGPQQTQSGQQTQQHTPQQQAQSQSQSQQQQAQQSSQQQNPTAQNIQQQALQRQQQALAAGMLRQQQMAQVAAQQQNRTNGSFILKLVLFSDHLSSFSLSKRDNDLEYWQNFVGKFFAPDGRLTQHIWTAENGRTKQFTMHAPLLPRYYWTYYNSGVQNVQLKLENAKEMPLQNNCHYVACEKAQFTFWFANGTQVIWLGKMSAFFPAGSDKFESLEFEVHKHDEFISKSEVQRVLSSNSPVMNRSPKLTKNQQKQKSVQKLQRDMENGLTLRDFPTAPVNTWGCTNPVFQYLEMSETFFFLRDMIVHAAKDDTRPQESIKALNQMFEEQSAGNQQGAGISGPQQAPQMQMQPNMQRPGQGQFGMGNRTPMQASMQLPPGAQQNFSPSVPNMNLPAHHLNGAMMMNGSPHIAQHQGLPGSNLAPNPSFNLGQSHTPSPAQSHMAAPSMIPQHSQQGTSSSAASANTSPNVNNKRRRSQVKLEGGEDGGLEMNGAQGQRVKASPRVGGPKKK